MNTLEAIAKRKSIRKYKAEQIDDAHLKEIVKAGKSAPQAGPFQMTVLQNQALLARISTAGLLAMKNSGMEFLVSRAALPGYTPLYGAPTLIILSAPKENPYSLANTSNAATIMTIAATDLELGSCFMVTPVMALAAEPALIKDIGVPSGYTPMCAVALGYEDGNAFTTKSAEVVDVNYVK